MGQKGAKVKRLEYMDPDDDRRKIQAGDFAFMGHGPEGACLVGIERKRVRDLISSIESGRLAGSQLPNMLKVYQVNYLIVEGWYRPNHNNLCLELPAGKGKWRDTIWQDRRMHYLALDAFLNTVRMKSPVQVIKTRTPHETAMEIHILHHWFQKDWEKHKSHLRFPYENPERVQTTRPNLCRRWAKELDNIGWERSKEAEAVFQTAHGLGNATVEKLELIDGITPRRAQQLWKEIRGLK
jgi:ERCC4-type nuclease